MVQVVLLYGAIDVAEKINAVVNRAHESRGKSKRVAATDSSTILDEGTMYHVHHDKSRIFERQPNVYECILHKRRRSIFWYKGH